MKGQAELLLERPLNTPFGEVHLPSLSLPTRLTLPTEERGKKALKHALGSDLSFIPGMIPIVGGAIADTLEDVHEAELKSLLTEEEFRRFLYHNKMNLASIAVIRAMMRV